MPHARMNAIKLPVAQHPVNLTGKMPHARMNAIRLLAAQHLVNLTGRTQPVRTNALKKIILRHLMRRGLVSLIGTIITANGNAKKKPDLLHLLNLTGKMSVAPTFAT